MLREKNKIVNCKKWLRETYENKIDTNFEQIHALEFELDKLLEEEEIY